MERFRKYLLVTLGFAFAGAIGAAFGTGKAEAVVASNVQVVNPATSPAFTVPATEPGRIPYQSQVAISCSGAQCIFTFPAVPANHRVVVQRLSAWLDCFSPAPTTVFVLLYGSASAVPTDTFTEGVQTPSGFAPLSAFDQTVLLYLDSSQSASGHVKLLGNSGAFCPSVGYSMTLSGFELDCTVAACAPIATQ